MTENLRSTGTGIDEIDIGSHTDIKCPVYIPEIKGAEGLHALLSHNTTLDEHNPVMVPAARWGWLKTKNEIVTRTNDNGDVVGEEQINSLERNHPILFYDPPELYNYKRTKALVNYISKIDSYDIDDFERELRQENYSAALNTLPEFFSPFLRANINRVLEETDGATLVSPGALGIDSTEEAWTSLSEQNYTGYYNKISEQVGPPPSSAAIPPVPQLGREWDDDLAEAWVVSNEVMRTEFEDDDSSDAYFHLYLNNQSLDPDAPRDTADRALEVLETEIEDKDYDGIALTVNRPNRIWQTGRAARAQTFIQGLSNIGREHSLPIISPRSEWFGSYATDYGIQAFSTLMNGAWQYPRYSSGGGPTGADKYGSVMIPNQARALKLQSDTNQDLEGYLSANGSLPDVQGLPSVPPTYNSSGNTVRQRFGTSFEFRKTFGKPRRLAHAEEAREFRDERQSGNPNPANEYLRTSENPYVEL